MKPKIEIPPEVLKSAHERVMSGQFYETVAKSIGLSKAGLRHKFKAAGWPHIVGKQRCAVFLPHPVKHEPKPVQNSRDQRIDKTWNHARSVEMLSRGLV
jgi:hypothetical protein